MNVFQRAWRYITRRHAKTILLMITFFLIGNLVILGLGISQAADNAKVLTRKQMRAAISYEIDYDAWNDYIDSITDEDEQNEAYKNFPKLDNDFAMKLAQDKRVKAYNFMLTYQGYSDGFDNVPLGNQAEQQDNSYTDENGNVVQYRNPNLMIYGIMDPNMIELAEGTFSVTNGDFISQNNIDNADNVCLITDTLAQQNGLSVGDTISFYTDDPNYLTDDQGNKLTDTDDYKMQLQIIGIYHNNEQVDQSSDQFQWMSPYENPQNIIITPMTSFENYYKQLLTARFRDQPSYYSETSIDEVLQDYSLSPSVVVFLLNDPLDVDQFVADYTLSLPKYTKLNANNETFKKLSRPLDTMSFFANIVVWIVIVNAVVIISLVTALTLKTREYEIGVLLALGVSKFKVILQLFLELIVIAFIGFAMASVSGSLLAGKVGDAVLNYQTTSDAQYGDDSDDNNYYWSDSTNYFTDVTQDDLLSQYHVSVSPKLIAEIFTLGSGVVLVAIVIPGFMIMRLNPKQILLEQN